MLALLIRGGFVVDGTGAPGRHADVGVHAGRVVKTGVLDEAAVRTIDADGLVVAPGFIDIHTHYDAQLLWDPSASPSPLHGITTVIAGNCGFTIAPLEPEQQDYLLHMLARVEGIPAEALRAGLDWDWRTFAEWLRRFDGAIGPNAGFLVGHSTIRRLVMGEAAMDGPATDTQIAAMVRLLDEAIAAGAMGFSSSHADSHNDWDGRPVPSRQADARELLALSEATGRHPGTQLEFIVTNGLFTDEHVALLTAMSRAADRPVNWNTLRVLSPDRSRLDHQLAAFDQGAADGACILALTYPDLQRARLFLSTGVGFTAIPGWREFVLLSVDEKRRAFADPAVRAAMRAGAATVTEDRPLARSARYDRYTFGETIAPANSSLAGRTVGDVAAERGVDPLDLLLDVVLADDLRTGVDLPVAADDDASWALRAEMALDPRTIVGASDAGAHLDVLCGSTYATTLLGTVARDRNLLSLEEAVRELTDVPARLYGLRARGRLAEGYWADVVVFDPAMVAPGPIETRKDLPGDAARQYAEARGIKRVFVNGTELVVDGELTGARSGAVLRSGADVDTVTVADALAQRAVGSAPTRLRSRPGV